jgi:hypothetical protein
VVLKVAGIALLMAHAGMMKLDGIPSQTWYLVSLVF